MLILSFIFLALAVVSLVKGNIFKNINIEIAEDSIKKKQVKYHRTDSELVVKTLFFAGFAIVYLITYALYLNAAIKIDDLKYPTLFMIAYAILAFSIGLKDGKKNKLETEEDIAKYRKNAQKKFKVKAIVGNLISAVYHSYIIYILVFM